jgi:hypothetical protein
VTGGPAASAALERRYRWLLRAYPADYRDARGEELVSTLLDAAPPGRSMPSPADVADLVGHGVRQRLGVARDAGFDAGRALAAPVALAIATGIAVFVWWRIEPSSLGLDPAAPTFGPYRTVGPVAYAAWVFAGLAAAVAPVRLVRALIVTALATTVAVPVVAATTTYDRPPLWILMALFAFGLLALAAPVVESSSWDERAGVPVGAAVVALGASAVTGAGPVGFYQPTVARVGVVVTVAVAALAVTALVQAVRGRPARAWLWATLLVALPGGWLGPFDSATWRLAAELAVPRFGRLAQVTLATCVVLAAMAWQLRPRDAGRRPGRMPVAAETVLGCTLGLAAFDSVLLGRPWWPIWLVPALAWVLLPRRTARPVVGVTVAAGAGLLAGFGPGGDPGEPHIAVTVLLLGVIAAVVGPPDRRAGDQKHTVRASVLRLFVGGAVTAAAALTIAAYDQRWSLTAWAELSRTATLVNTLTFVPFTLLALAAAWTVASRSAAPAAERRTARVALLGAIGWLGYATLPYLFAWGPVLLLLLACLSVVLVRRSFS